MRICWLNGRIWIYVLTGINLKFRNSMYTLRLISHLKSSVFTVEYTECPPLGPNYKRQAVPVHN
jgi:hypothetical protein